MAPIPPNPFQAGRAQGAKKGRTGQENTFTGNTEKNAPTVKSMFAVMSDSVAPRITKATIFRPPIVIPKENAASRVGQNDLTNRSKLTNNVPPASYHSTTSTKPATAHKEAKAGPVSRIPRLPRGAPRRSALTDITKNAQINTVTTIARPGTPIPPLQEAIKKVLVAEKGHLAAREMYQGQVTHLEPVIEAMDTHVDQRMKRMSLDGTHIETTTTTTTRIPLQNHNLNIKKKHSPQDQTHQIQHDTKASTITIFTTDTTMEDASTKEQPKTFPNHDQQFNEKQAIPSNNQPSDANAGDVDMDERSNGSTIFPRRLLTEQEYFLNEDYADRIFQYMKENEATYVDGRNLQFWANRTAIVDCICNYGCAIRANLECVFLAVNIMDRVLAKDGPEVLEPRILIIGFLSLLIAAKYEDGVRPLMDLMTVSEILDSRGFHVDLDAIRLLEWRILKSINFKLAWPGPLMFLRRCSRADDVNPEARMMGKYLLEIMLYDRRFLIYVPSHQAATALYVSRMILSRAEWTDLLVEYSGYQESQLRSLCLHLLEFLASDIIQRTSVYTKYSVRECYRVSVFVAHWAPDIFQLLVNQ
ncbi:G2/mitotic-specific cyclin [Podila minutissima]|uniref:G2/mitotic-specific cyclin n=1 Tax=Podila minutissima TaxID=64525 RepID=A0A9P5VHM7_9FUNG|nr:G2/mitotic-specific cyclin [Podila minutissima]